MEKWKKFDGLRITPHGQHETSSRRLDRAPYIQLGLRDGRALRLGGVLEGLRGLGEVLARGAQGKEGGGGDEAEGGGDGGGFEGGGHGGGWLVVLGGFGVLWRWWVCSECSRRVVEVDVKMDSR